MRPLAPIFSPAVSVQQGSYQVTVTGNVDCSAFNVGTVLHIGNYGPTTATSGTEPDENGISTITLARPWAGPDVTGEQLLASMGYQDLLAAIYKLQDLRAAVNPLKEQLEHPFSATSIAGQSAHKVASATSFTRELIEAFKTPQDVLDAIEAAEEFEGELGNLKSSTDEQIGNVNNSLNDLRNPDSDFLVSGIPAKEIAQSTIRVAGIKNLKPLPDITQHVGGFYPGTSAGGGVYVYNQYTPKSGHNGGSVLAPEAIEQWDGTEENLNQLLEWSGSGNGCYNKRDIALDALDFGLTHNGASAADAINKAASVNLGVGGGNGTRLIVPSGNFTVSKKIRLGNTRVLEGSSGFIGSKLIASDDFPSHQSVVHLDGDWSSCININAQVPASRYERDKFQVTAPSNPVHCFDLTTFGGSLTRFRALGGDIGVRIAPRSDGTFTAENKLFHGHIRLCRTGVDISRWDSEIHSTIIEECRVGVNTTTGLEANMVHPVRCVDGFQIRDNGNPVHMTNTFIDSCLRNGVWFLGNSRSAHLVNTYVLKPGNAGELGSNFRAFNFANGSDFNQIHNVAVRGGTTHLGSLFFFGPDVKNNVISGVDCPAKTASAGAQVERMRRQTVYGCTSEAARYNNIVRKNRYVIGQGDFPAGSTQNIIVTLDYDYSYSNNEYMTIIFYGHWVAYGTNNRTSYGRLYLPVNFNLDVNSPSSEPIIERLSGFSGFEFEVVSVSLSGDALLLSIKNNCEFNSSFAFEIERSIDSRGRTF
ncbi:hypothetical protein ABC502_07980 [Alkalimonas sp. NCh-2]|uniref:hypothetical protein n=1 Tax=Alkalimonas sp. NCh-2 TaxID=3144846 RepID=UPI0031F63031